LRDFPPHKRADKRNDKRAGRNDTAFAVIIQLDWIIQKKDYSVLDCPVKPGNDRGNQL
jgi:hypothetical protein